MHTEPQFRHTYTYMKACRTHAGYRGAFPCWRLQEGSERDAYLDLRLVTSQFSTPFHQ